MATNKKILNPERMPPQNVEVEQNVLGCLMIDEQAITKIADILKADDFYRSDHEKIFQSIVDLYETSDLPHAANRSKISELLIDIYCDFYKIDKQQARAAVEVANKEE